MCNSSLNIIQANGLPMSMYVLRHTDALYTKRGLGL